MNTYTSLMGMNLLLFFPVFLFLGYSLWTRNNWKKQEEFRYLDMAAGMWQFSLHLLTLEFIFQVRANWTVVQPPGNSNRNYYLLPNGNHHQQETLFAFKLSWKTTVNYYHHKDSLFSLTLYVEDGTAAILHQVLVRILISARRYLVNISECLCVMKNITCYFCLEAFVLIL